MSEAMRADWWDIAVEVRSEKAEGRSKGEMQSAVAGRIDSSDHDRGYLVCFLSQ